MRGLSIAVLNPGSQMGGAEVSLLELLRRLDADFRVTLILPEDGPLRAAAEAAGAETRVVPWPKRVMAFGECAGVSGLAPAVAAASVVRGLRLRLAAAVREAGADCVLTNGIKCHLLAAAAKKQHRLPLVWYGRDGLAKRPLSSALLRAYGRRCDGAIAISHYVAGEYRQVLPPQVPIEVVYNMVDLRRFRPGLTPPRDLQKREGEIWFGVVGALTPLKGQDLFLQACREVCRVLPSARFLLVGSNFYHTEKRLRFGDELRALAESAGIADRVIFLGQRDDVPAVFSTLDVLVQPNRSPEGLGRSVLEAMACAVPVIAVDRWGPAEVVQDGETGLLTPWLDVKALAARMIALGKDPELRRRLGENGRHWVLCHLVPDDLVARFRQIVRTIVSDAGALTYRRGRSLVSH